METKQVVGDEETTMLLVPRNRDDKGSNSNSKSNASFSGSMFNLSTTIIGAGIMALPVAIKVLGLVVGIAAIIFLAFLTHISLEILLRFSRVAKAATYGEFTESSPFKQLMRKKMTNTTKRPRFA